MIPASQKSRIDAAAGIWVRFFAKVYVVASVSLIFYKGKMNHPITSKRLRIRRFERGDAEDFVSFVADPESTRFLTFGEEQKSREGAKKLLDVTIASYDSEAPLMAFAVEHKESRQFVGFCGLTPREEGVVEIMYAVMPDERGKGYATEIAATLAQYAVNQLGYRRVIAPVSPEHEVSKAVALKAGFRDRGIGQNPGSSEVVRLFVLEQEQLTKRWPP